MNTTRPLLALTLASAFIGLAASHAAAFKSPIAPGAELTLKQAIALALQYHPRHKEFRASEAAARQRIGEAQSALLPQLYGASDYLRTTDNGIGNTSYYDLGMFPRMTGRNHNLPANDFSQSSMTANNYLGGISLSQFLFDFGRRHGFVNEREFEAAAAEERAGLTDLDLIFGVSRRYFALLEAKQLVRVYQKALEERRYHLREAQVKAKVGLRPELDVYVMEEQVQRAQLHLVEANNAVADAKVALDNAMGLSEAAPDYQLADVLTYSEIKGAQADLLRTAFKLRPDLKMLAAEAKALGAQVVEYRSDYFPTANLAAGYATMGTGLPATNNFNLGLVIVWPIFNGYLTSDQIEEAKLKQQAVRDAFDDLRQNVIQEVSTTFLNWRASRVKIQRAEKALAAARVELELADKRYAAGLSDIIELEDAERHYTDDDAGYTDALYGFSVAEAAVDRATARTLGRR